MVFIQFHSRPKRGTKPNFSQIGSRNNMSENAEPDLHRISIDQCLRVESFGAPSKQGPIGPMALKSRSTIWSQAFDSSMRKRHVMSNNNNHHNHNKSSSRIWRIWWIIEPHSLQRTRYFCGKAHHPNYGGAAQPEVQAQTKHFGIATYAQRLGTLSIFNFFLANFGIPKQPF